MTEPATPLGSPAAPTPTPASTPNANDRRFAVGVAIALAALLFLLASGILYLRWATMREPTCVLIIQAPVTMRGAEVTVDGLGVGPKPHQARIGVGERFVIPFYLDYGTYRVVVTFNDATLVDEEINLTREAPGQRLELSKLPLSLPTSPPATSSSTSSFPPRVETGDLPRLTPPSPGGRLSP